MQILLNDLQILSELVILINILSAKLCSLKENIVELGRYLELVLENESPHVLSQLAWYPDMEGLLQLLLLTRTQVLNIVSHHPKHRLNVASLATFHLGLDHWNIESNPLFDYFRVAGRPFD